MQLNDKSAAVLYSLLGEINYIDLEKSELLPLFEDLETYFDVINKQEMIDIIRVSSNKVKVDFNFLEEILKGKK